MFVNPHQTGLERSRITSWTVSGHKTYVYRILLMKSLLFSMVSESDKAFFFHLNASQSTIFFFVVTGDVYSLFVEGQVTEGKSVLWRWKTALDR